MYGADELFCSQSLDEKTDPAERFIQALNEFGASGVFRKLLESHFILTWERELGSIDDIERALESTQQAATFPEKISAFISSISGKYSGGWFQLGFASEEMLQIARNRYPSRFAFAQDVAAQVFPQSPYGFYQCFGDSINIPFEIFIMRVAPDYYGEFDHLIPLLVNDQKFDEASESTRGEYLWAVFEHMVKREFPFADYLMRLFSWETYASVPTRETLQFSKVFVCLNGWLAADAKFRAASVSRELLDSILYDFLSELESKFSEQLEKTGTSIDEAETRVLKSWAKKWFQNKRHEMSKAWCCSLKLEGLAELEIEAWARRSYECYLPLCDGLTAEKAEFLIAWGVNEDLRKMLDPKVERDSLLSRLDFNSNSALWYLSAFRETWLSHLINSIKVLSFEAKLCVLRRGFGWDIKVSDVLLPQYVTLPQESYKKDESGYGWFEFRVEASDREWWDSLLLTLPDDETFPKSLYPSWSIEVLARFGNSEEFTSFSDKSLGIVRGDIANGDIQLKEEDIKPLLRNLEQYAPEKALRHRLLLLRNSPQPCTSENLDLDRNSLCPLTMAEILKEFISAHFWHESRCHLRTSKERIDEELQLLFSVREWFAKFCLSRLQLRKGEKTSDNGYQPGQVVEQSATWRKAYLKVLEELGVDLQGKVHKTIYFVRQFDPAEDVREVAKVSYKAVRREHNKSETGADIQRGLTAAYWWLLLAQRHALGVKVNEEGAVRTRRRLMRRP